MWHVYESHLLGLDSFPFNMWIHIHRRPDRQGRELILWNAATGPGSLLHCIILVYNLVFWTLVCSDYSTNRACVAALFEKRRATHAKYPDTDHKVITLRLTRWSDS